MLLTWPDKDHAIVVLVARHDGSGADVYGQLLVALAITALGDEREKPQCCDDEGQPPADPAVASDIAEAVEGWARTQRRSP